MRTDSPKTAAPAVARLRAEFARARRRLASRPPALRWSLGLAALAALLALAYALNGTTTAAISYVRSGDPFSNDDLIAVTHALNAKHIDYQIDSRNRVVVAPDRVAEADEVVAKSGIGPRSLSEIDKWAGESSLMDTMDTRDQRREQAANARLGAMIGRMDGIVAAHVSVHRIKPRGIGRPNPTASALVYLETKDDREISSATVGKIQEVIAASVPEVKPDAVDVFDRKMNHYLDPRNPAVGARWKDRALGEEWSQEVLKQLDGLKLKGVEVSVKLVPAPAVPTPAPLPTLSTAADAPPLPAEEVGLPLPSVGVNEPLELTIDPPDRGRTPAVARPSPVPVASSSPAAVPPAKAPDPPRARVLVKVPRSFYLKAVNRRGPTLDDIQPLVEKTKDLIEKAVRHVVPPGQLEEPVEVVTFPDEPPAQDIPPPPGATDARRVFSWWVAMVLAGGTTAALLGVVFRILLVRRPATRPAARGADDRGRFKIDEASDPGPGPSERVRELIRVSPEAAASVLHRWTGQGGAIG